MSYAAHLRHLNVPSLQLWRLHLDLIYCYKIVFSLVDLKFSNFFEFCPTKRTRGNPGNSYSSIQLLWLQVCFNKLSSVQLSLAYKLFKAFSWSVHNRFFTDRVINVWNCLPQTVNFGTLPGVSRNTAPAALAPHRPRNRYIEHWNKTVFVAWWYFPWKFT